MISNFKTKKQDTHTSARVVDGKFILSLPDALNPVVWQMDLDTAKASALEVQNEGEKHTLTLKTLKGETVKIASFENRAQAVEALMAASHALENAHGMIRGANTNANYSESTNVKAQKPKKGRVLKAVIALVVLFAIFTLWSMSIPRTQMPGGMTRAAALQPENLQESTGVPVSADAYLRGQ